MPEQTKLPIKPPHIAFLLLFLSWLAKRLFPQFNSIAEPYNKLGIFVFAAGLSLTFWGFYVFKKNKTPIVPGQRPTFMVMEGPYKFTRNPMYLGVTIALFGAAVYIGNLLSFLAPVAFLLAMNSIYIPFEEKLMQKIFGRQYLNYKKKVRRWV